MIVENMSGADLVEMYGYDESELMGFSLKKIGKGITKGAKAVGKVATKSVVGKAVSYTVKKPGRALAIAAAPATGGLSLLATKKGRDTVGTAARFAQKKILRPVGGVVATAARNPAVQKAAMTAARGFAASATGGQSELALQAARRFLPTKPATPAPAPTASASSAMAKVRERLRKAREAIQPGTDAAQVTAPSGISMPMVLGVGGGIAALALLALAMGGKKSS